MVKERGYEYVYPLSELPCTITYSSELVCPTGSSVTSGIIYDSHFRSANLEGNHSYELLDGISGANSLIYDPVKGTYKIELTFNRLYHIKKTFEVDFELDKIISWSDISIEADCITTTTYTLKLGTGPRDLINWPYGGLNHCKDIFFDSLFTADNMISYIRRMLSEDRLLSLPTFSLGNFIAEFHEIKSLGTLHRQRVSGGFLGINFGVLPLIGDLKAMFTIFDQFESKVALWNSYVFKRLTLNYHTTLLNEDITDTVIIDDSSIGLGFYRYTIKLDVKVLIKSSVYLRPLEITTDQYRSITLALTGLDDPAKIIWEAVPYSFIVDWFLNIGDMIEQIDFDESAIKFLIESCGFSRSIKGTIQVLGEYHAPDGTSFSLGSNTETLNQYERFPINLNDYTSGNFSTTIDDLKFSNSMNAYKGLLLSALVDQRIRR